MLPRSTAFLVVSLVCVFLFFIVTFRNESSDLLSLNAQWSRAVSIEKSRDRYDNSSGSTTGSTSANASVDIDTDAAELTNAVVANTSVVNNTPPDGSEFTNDTTTTTTTGEHNRSTMANHSIPADLLSRGDVVGDLANFAAVSRRRGQFALAPVNDELLAVGRHQVAQDSAQSQLQ